jgi:hypothetical protein
MLCLQILRYKQGGQSKAGSKRLEQGSNNRDAGLAPGWVRT